MDKAILLYAIVHDLKFDLGFVIENSILEVLQNRCTGAHTHPSLITLLCKLAGVPMSESEEKTLPKLPLPMPKQRMVSRKNLMKRVGKTKMKSLRRKSWQQSNHRNPWIRRSKS